jgi:hypothetical protein
MLRLITPLLAVTLLGGCFSRAILPERPIFECHEEPVLCKPGTFDEIKVDTSRISYTAGTRVEQRLAIDRVRGLDGSAGEFGVAFGRSGTEGFATIRGTSEALQQVRFRDATTAVLEGIVDVRGLSSPYGSAARSARGDSLWLTARIGDRVKGDYDIFAGVVTQRTVATSSRLTASSIVGWDAQPAISPDGSALYFVSDRRGGFGGTDIYVIRKTSMGGWSPPQNLGPAINTPCDELSPFVSGNGRWLYFSSAGHATVGGYDIFRSPILGEQLGAVENLGRPINTPADEIFPSAPAEASTDTLLYYSSNQTHTGGFDMFVLHRLVKGTGRPVAQTERERQIERERDRTSNRDLIDSITLDGRVRTRDGRPVDGALVTIENGDPPQRDSTRTNSEGRFTFRIEEGRTYGVTAGPEGRLPGRTLVYVPPSNQRPSVVGEVVLPDTITFRVNFPFNNATDPYEFTLDDRGLPTAERWTEVVDRLARFLRSEEGGGEKIEIVGHTDPVGSDPFNLDLGRRRAEFVRRELIRRGVRSSLLSVRSEGESAPLPGQLDEPQELYHARLRRVELVRR